MRTRNMLIGGLGGALLAAGTVLILTGCRSIPRGATAVTGFDLERYLGKWYEIARLDFRHEKGLSNVTAEYSLRSDGKVKVVNRGYDVKKQEWEEAVGKAKLAGDPNEGMLKVSFFGPFYSGYNVIAIDPQYKYALVIGKNHDYMWILSREKTMPEDVKQSYLDKAYELGYEVSDLVWTSQD